MVIGPVMGLWGGLWGGQRCRGTAVSVSAVLCGAPPLGGAVGGGRSGAVGGRRSRRGSRPPLFVLNEDPPAELFGAREGNAGLQLGGSSIINRSAHRRNK